MKKLTLLFLLLASTNVLAEYSEFKSQSCRDASIRYKTLSVWMDSNLVAIIKNGLKMQEIKKNLAAIETYKNTEYKNLIALEEGFINKGTSRITGDAWRVFMEAGIDFALGVPMAAAEPIEKALVETPSVPSDFSSLGKSEDYYQRKIYDACMY
jgi:hypothetical protein